MSSTARKLHSSLEAARQPTAWETRCSTKAKLRKRFRNCNARIVYGRICPRRSILSARRILRSVMPNPPRRRGQESLRLNGRALSRRKHILVWRDSTGSEGMPIKPHPKCKNSTNCRSVAAVLVRTDAITAKEDPTSGNAAVVMRHEALVLQPVFCAPPYFAKRRRLPHRRIRGTEDARGTVFPNPRVYHPLGFSSEVAAFCPSLLTR